MSQEEEKPKLPPYRTLRCPLSGHQVTSCRCLCKPIEGYGLCGRPAPHKLKGRTQRAIARYKECQEAA